MRRIVATCLAGLAVAAAPAGDVATADGVKQRVPKVVGVGSDDPARSVPRILSASLDRPTDRYGHRVLGAEGEYAEMLVVIAVVIPDTGPGVARVEAIHLPNDRVFEDVDTDPAARGVNARVADLDGDGKNEVIVVESSTTGGAALTVYGLNAEGRVVRLAASPPIGRRNRWLAVAGIADFDADGQNDIAYVETPHIGGTLRIWTMRDGKLVQIAEAPGVSNHRIGEDFISGGVRDCGDGPELVVATHDWNRLVRAWMVDGRLEIEPISRSSRPDVWDRAMKCEL